jgi:hypothetical protein
MKKWNNQKIDMLKDLYDQGSSYNEIASQLNTSYDSVDKALRKYYPDRNAYVASIVSPMLKLSLNHCIIAGDWHIPLHRHEYIKIMLEYAKKHNIDDIIVNGDFFDCLSFSTFLKGHVEMSWSDEKAIAKRYLDDLCWQFNMVYFTIGNHEIRWSRKLDGIDKPESIFKLLDGDYNNYQVTPNDYLLLNDEYYVCHPFNSSTVPFSVANRLSMKYEKSIVSGHCHRIGLTKSFSGKHWVIESGGLFDRHKMEYVMRTNTYSTSCNGFVVIEKNSPPQIICL